MSYQKEFYHEDVRFILFFFNFILIFAKIDIEIPIKISPLVWIGIAYVLMILED
jgi:hypothetical protein